MSPVSQHAQELEDDLLRHSLDLWYPRCRDDQCGGFLSSFSHDWRPVGDQSKLIVTQARHTWTCAKAAAAYPSKPIFLECARHGFEWLNGAEQWDVQEGGWFKVRSREGGESSWNGYGQEKRSYGMAFGLYACAAYHKVSGETAALDRAVEAFRWLEQYAHDPDHGGYFNAFARDGSVLTTADDSVAYDGWSVDYKDEDDQMHILEAFTELYHCWPDETLRKRIAELVELTLGRMLSPRGHKLKFFTHDWTHVVSHPDPGRTHDVNHVDFGHDIEMAFLLLEATEALGAPDDPEIRGVARGLADHTLRHGWDEAQGGVYDRGYYDSPESTECLIVERRKYWWAQAEAMNTTLLLSVLFPEDADRYRAAHYRCWDYIKRHVIDEERGGWFVFGLDSVPGAAGKRKGQQWKATYHEVRALLNCLRWTRGDTAIAG